MNTSYRPKASWWLRWDPPWEQTGSAIRISRQCGWQPGSGRQTVSPEEADRPQGGQRTITSDGGSQRATEATNPAVLGQGKSLWTGRWRSGCQVLTLLCLVWVTPNQWFLITVPMFLHLKTRYKRPLSQGFYENYIPADVRGFFFKFEYWKIDYWVSIKVKFQCYFPYSLHTSLVFLQVCPHYTSPGDIISHT